MTSCDPTRAPTTQLRNLWVYVIYSSSYISNRKKNNRFGTISKFILVPRVVIQHIAHVLRGYCTPGPYIWRLCAFRQKIKQLWTKYPMDLSEMLQGTQKPQFYFSKGHCCDVTVKNVRKLIFSMFWTINQ